jgi:hypothetical protein
VYLTVFNDTGAACAATLTVDLTALQPGFSGSAVPEMLSGESLAGERQGDTLRVPVSLDREDVKVLWLR